MDIANLLESHRTNLLADIKGRLDGHPSLSPYQVLEICYDRATIKVLLAALGNGQQPVGQAALTTPPPTASRKVKAGSKAARQRALKAGETRRKNLAAKAQQQGSNTPTNSKLAAVANEPAGQPFVQTGEGGGQ